MALRHLSARFQFTLYASEDVCPAARQDEDEGPGADSELEESESEAEGGAEELKMTPQLCSYVPTAEMAPSGIRGCQKAQAKSTEEVGHHPARNQLLWNATVFFFCQSLYRLV